MATPDVSTPIRAAIYARVSTSEQSPELQLRDLRQYAEARGLESSEYVDSGYSGAKQNRPALDRLMDDARKRRFDCILVWRFDRFARSTKHLLLALEEFRGLETHPGTRVFERKISVRGLASWWARSTNYVQAGSERAKSRLQASKRAIRRPFCDAAAASAGRAPAASACRLLCPLTKLRLATTAAITSCHRVFVFPK